MIDIETQKNWWDRFEMPRYMRIVEKKNYPKYRFLMLYLFGISVK